MSEQEYKTQLKNLMMLENEKKSEIEARIAESDREFHEKLMREFIEKQRQGMLKLNTEM